jgi:hypothetical protein
MATYGYEAEPEKSTGDGSHIAHGSDRGRAAG